MANAFHKTAIAHEAPCSVINESVITFIKSRSHELLSHCHAYSVRQALSEGACGCLYAGRITVLGVTRRSTVKLSKIFYVVDGQIVAR